MNRDNILKEYKKLIEKLEIAEKWALDKNIEWDKIAKYNYKTEDQRNKYIEFAWKRDNIIKEIEATRELLELPA